MRPPLRKAQVAPSPARAMAGVDPRGADVTTWGDVQREGASRFRGLLNWGDWKPTPAPMPTLSLSAFAELPRVRAPDAMALLDRIAEGEGTSDAKAAQHGFASGYDVTLDYGAYAKSAKPLSQMTLDEVDALQTEILRNPRNRSNSSAAGRYQITQETLGELRKSLGLKGDEVFDVDLQDRLAEMILRQQGIEKYRAGKMGAAAFQDGLAARWSSVAMSGTGQSRYGHRTGTSTAEIQAAIAGLQKR